VQELAAEQVQRAALAATVRKLALPVIPVLQGVVIMPLVGDFDLVRSEEFTSVLLQAIEREHAHLALIDITGVPVLDTLGAMSLVRATEAAALLGARCMLVGIRPEIAQALVALGVPLGNLTTAASLQQGLASVLKR
jgi:anti-anti-sigma regulatory factor